MLCRFSRSGEEPSLALVFQPEALAVDTDNDRVVQDTIEHCDGEHAITGEGGIPTAESKIGSEDPRATFVPLRHDLEEQVRLLAAHRQIADLVDDQQPVGVDRAMHRLAVAALAL